MTDNDIHARMAAAYARQGGQALADEKRRDKHFQVRLPPDLAMQLTHYMQSRDLNANQALLMIISKFFN